MKILHIHPSLAGGGIEAVICALLNEMVGHNDVTMATIFSPKDSDVFENKLDKRIKRISLGKVKPGFSLSEIFKIYRYIEYGNFDVVHVHGFFYYYVLSVLLLHKKVKFFYTVHSDAEMENVKWDRYILFLKKRCFKRGYIRPITISPASQSSFRRFYNTDTCLIPNGIAKPEISADECKLTIYKLTENTRIFLHPGRITEAKNQLVLCKVFKKIVEDGYDVTLIIAGSKQDVTIYSALEPYLNDRIHYIGERTDIPQLLSESDAMCLPSIWEGLPITLLEALSVGCIPICSPVGGIVNVIKSGYNGILSKSANEYDYYDAIRQYLSLTDGELASIQRNCKTSFLTYDISVCCRLYIEEYLKP